MALLGNALMTLYFSTVLLIDICLNDYMGALSCDKDERHGVLELHVTRGFIPKKIQWHIHTGLWSLVN